MSVQSLQNQSLTLRELTVSNAYDSQASGYVAQSTTITPAGFTATSVVTDTVVITGGGSTSSTALSTNSGNGLVVSTASNAGLSLSSPLGGFSIIARSGYAEITEEVQVPSIVTDTVVITGGGSASSTALSTNSGNGLVISTASNAGLSLSSPLGGCLLTTQPGYLSISETIDVPIIQISGGGATTKPIIGSNVANNLVISTASGVGLTLSSPLGNGTLSVNSSNQLLWNDVVIS
jgi:hypothetical protein